MRVLEDRQRQRPVVAVGRWIEAVRPFHQPPSVVAAAGASRLEVDFFPLALADVGDEHVAGDAIETESPWVAIAVRPDLRTRTGSQHEGVADRRGVWRAGV